MAELPREKSVTVHYGNADLNRILQEMSTLVGGGDVKRIFQCIQVEAKGTATVTFCEDQQAKLVDEKGELVVEGEVVTFQKASVKITTVIVRNLPYEIDEPAVKSLYAPYGKVKSVERDRIRVGPFTGICNGNWIVRLEMKSELPNYSAWGEFTAVNTYKGVRKLCKRCGEPDHLVAECKKPRTFAAVVAEETDAEKSPPKPKDEERPKQQNVQLKSILKTTESSENKGKDTAPRGKTGAKTKQVRRPTKLPPESVSFLKSWLEGKLEKDYQTRVEDAVKKGLIPDDKDIREQAENHESVCFETTGELVFQRPKEGAGVEPGREVYNTKEMNLKAYSFLGPLKT